MKTRRNLIQLGLLLAGLLAPAPDATAQTYTLIKSFTNILDGAIPRGLLLDGSTLYGTTEQGGSGTNYGTVFKVNTDGTGFTVLKSFAPDSLGMLSDGVNPYAGLTLCSNVLYGTTVNGGVTEYGGSIIGGAGTLFKINTDGTGFTKLFVFHGNPSGGPIDVGTYPNAGLTLCSNVLYGTTAYGGLGGGGYVFKINTDGSGFTNLARFHGIPDGAVPYAGVTLWNNVLYGTTAAGGSDGYDGTIFKVNTDGTGYAILHNFTNTPDGAVPYAGLTLDTNGIMQVGDYQVGVLYGTTQQGGSANHGTIFQINTDGTGYKVINNFTDSPASTGPLTPLTLVGKTLYGTTYPSGSVFQVNTDGTDFITLKAFTLNPNDGEGPLAGVILSGSTLYGTTSAGGDFGGSVPSIGTLFSISLVPTLAIAAAGNQAILSWPIWAPNFSLQSATNLAAPVWNAITDATVVVGTNNVVTNAISGDQQFYRLSQ